MRTLMTPRNPWSFFLNLRWSKTWTARMLSSVTRLWCVSYERNSRDLRRVQVRGGDIGTVAEAWCRGRDSRDSQVETLVPVRVQGPFRNGSRLGLLAVDCSNGERVREACWLASVMQCDGVECSEGRTKNISLAETIGRNDCKELLETIARSKGRQRERGHTRYSDIGIAGAAEVSDTIIQ